LEEVLLYGFLALAGKCERAILKGSMPFSPAMKKVAKNN
jgi:hypothetical protein